MNENDDLLEEDGYQLAIKPRPMAAVTLKVPVDTLEALGRIADDRDMSVEALMKLYVGQGLRQDLAKRFGERLLESTASVLSRHLESEQEISAILREIQLETAQVE